MAWDPQSHKAIWSVSERFPVLSGALTTASGLVFYGSLDGYIRALGDNGRELFKFKTPSGIVGDVFTYEFEGRQYVGVLSGIGGEARRSVGEFGFWPHAGFEVYAAGALDKYVKLGGDLIVFSLP